MSRMISRRSFLKTMAGGVVLAGLGCSMLPVRFGVPPEIVIIEAG